MYNFYLAHAGETHQTAAEAASHAGPQLILTAVAVSLAIAAFLAAGAYAIKRFAKVEVINEENEEQ